MLLEMVAVIAILALAAGLAGWSLKSARPTPTFESVAEQIAAYDRSARTYARRFNQPVELNFRMYDVSSQVIEAPAGAHPPTRLTLYLPSGFTVDQVQPSSLGDAVRVSDQGRTPSYAVVLAGASGRRWIFFSGLTGEMQMVDNLEASERLWSLLRARQLDERLLLTRPDAR